MFDRQTLAKLWPNGDPAWIDSFATNFERWGNQYGPGESIQRWHHFLAQVSAETDGLVTSGRNGACGPGLTENLNYHPASLLAANGYRVRKAARDIPRFRSLSLEDVAAALCADHDLLAETVYGNRADIGNVQPGDGLAFIGRSPLQCTGREIYTDLAHYLNIDCVAHPERLGEPDIGWQASFYEWAKLGCNKLADTGDVDKVSRRVNGGDNGLASRRSWLKKAQILFPDCGARSLDPNAVETASLTDLKAAGSRSAGQLITLKTGSQAVAGVSAAVEVVNQIGDTMQSATSSVTKITSALPDGIKPSVTQAAQATHDIAKQAHSYIGIGTFLLAVVVAVVALKAGEYLLAAYRSGRYVPAGAA